MVLGVPIVSYISSMTSLRIGMLFFAAANGAALIAAIFAVPDFPVKEKLSYGSQLSVLKESETWLSIIIGNLIAGRMLSSRPLGFVVTFGYFTVPMAVLTFVWGVLAGAGANINQYWLATAAPKAPDFANGLFLASTNLGTTVGTSVCGYFLSRMGTRYIVLGGILFIACAFVLIPLRVRGETKTETGNRKLKTA